MKKTQASYRFNLYGIESRLSKSGEEGIVEGYASVFNVKDSYGSVILKGAFTETLQNGLSRIKVLWNHDANEPIGKLIAAYEDETGLYVRYQLSLGVQKARDIFNLIKDGVIDSMSFGFSIDDYAMDQGTLVIQKVTLWDVSPVTFPANTQAVITTIRNQHSLNNQVLSVKTALRKLILEVQEKRRQYGS